MRYNVGKEVLSYEKNGTGRGALQDHVHAAKNSWWQLEILYYIVFHDIRRFGALRRQLGEITESSLTKQLRELEADGFLIRHDFHEVPPRVEYTLTELGRSFMDVIAYMKEWGDHNLKDAECHLGTS